MATKFSNGEALKNSIMTTFLLLSKYSDSVVKTCKATTREEAIEIFAEMGYYQEDYTIKIKEKYNENTPQIVPYRMRGISDDCAKK